MRFRTNLSRTGRWVEMLTSLVLILTIQSPELLMAKKSPIPFSENDPLTPLLTALTESKSSAERKRAADEIGRMRDLRAIPWLMSGLEDESAMVRATLVTSLGLLRARESVKEIARLLSTDKDPHVREASAVALQRLGDSRVTHTLLEALSDTAPGVRFKAADALGALHAQEAVPALIKLLRDTSPDMRRIAAESLGEIGSDKALTDLRLLLTDKDLAVRREATRSVGLLRDKESVETLKQLLTSPDDELRVAAAYALGRVGDASGKKTALQILRRKGSSALRARAAHALAEMGDASVIPSLQRVAKEDDPFLKQQVLSAIEVLQTNKGSKKK